MFLMIYSHYRLTNCRVAGVNKRHQCVAAAAAISNKEDFREIITNINHQI